MREYYRDDQATLLLGDALDVLRELPDGSVDCIVTSPPYYGLRDYGMTGQYGLEASPSEYVGTMRAVFGEARRVLADDGTLWLNLGDSYGSAPEQRSRSGIKPRSSRRRDGAPVAAPRDAVRGRRKSLLMIPERVCLALCDDGWILRNKIVWRKTNCMPERVEDRFSGRHEAVYLLVSQERYWFDLNPLREKKNDGITWEQRKAAGAPGWHGLAGHSAVETVPSLASHPLGANPGDVWSLPTARSPDAHFAVMPLELARRCITAGCRPGGIVLDPFSGSGTTGDAARNLGRHYVGIDIKPAYHDLAIKRFAQTVLDFTAS
ncbi:DNA-methyltransferase [Streptomyces sp. 7R007]